MLSSILCRCTKGYDTIVHAVKAVQDSTQIRMSELFPDAKRSGSGAWPFGGRSWKTAPW